MLERRTLYIQAAHFTFRSGSGEGGGYRSAQRHFISSILTSKSNNLCCAGRTPLLATMRHSPGGCAQKKGAPGTRSNAIGARALYSPLSPPRIFYAWFVYSATVATDREVHRGPPPGASGEGGSSLHGPISAMHRTQRAPFDEKHAHQRRP